MINIGGIYYVLSIIKENKIRIDNMVTLLIIIFKIQENIFMKKIFCIMAILILTFSLSACTGEEKINNNRITSQEGRDRIDDKKRDADEIDVVDSDDTDIDIEEKHTIENADVSEADDGIKEADSEVDEANRKMIAEALGVDENSRNIKFIIAFLNSLDAGVISDVEFNENEQNRMTIVFKAEDGTNYKMYLSLSGSPMEVKNLDTGDWPITSEM